MSCAGCHIQQQQQQGKQQEQRYSHATATLHAYHLYCCVLVADAVSPLASLILTFSAK